MPSMQTKVGGTWELEYKILQEFHDDPLVTHIGRDKIYAVSHKVVYLGNMKQVVADHVKLYETYKVIKASREVPKGLLMPLPKNKWGNILMGFPTSLLKTQWKNIKYWMDDQITKIARFIACNMTYKAHDIEKILIEEVFTNW